MRSPSRNAPCPRHAVCSTPVTGWKMAPAVTTPSSSSPIITAQVGMRRTKFRVPSIGSMMKRRARGPVSPSSSPRVP